MHSNSSSRNGVLLLVILAVLGIVLLIVSLMTRKKRGTYDERQALVRGKAAQIALVVLVSCNLLHSMLYWILDRSFFECGVAEVLGVYLAATVFTCVCIVKDAYFPVGSHSEKMSVLAAVLLVLSCVPDGIRSLRKGDVVRNGVLTSQALPLFLVGSFLVILLVLYAKRVAMKRSEKRL